MCARTRCACRPMSNKTKNKLLQSRPYHARARRLPAGMGGQKCAACTHGVIEFNNQGQSGCSAFNAMSRIRVGAQILQDGPHTAPCTVHSCSNSTANAAAVFSCTHAAMPKRTPQPPAHTPTSRLLASPLPSPPRRPLSALPHPCGCQSRPGATPQLMPGGDFPAHPSSRTIHSENFRIAQ